MSYMVLSVHTGNTTNHHREKDIKGGKVSMPDLIWQITTLVNCDKLCLCIRFIYNIYVCNIIYISIYI